jgi:hypothetical protein
MPDIRGSMILVALTIGLISNVFARDFEDDISVLGLDEANHTVHFTGSFYHRLYSWRLSEEDLWDGRVPPWLKVGVLYGKVDDSGDFSEPFSVLHLHYWGQGDEMEVAVTLKGGGKPCEAGHWTWTGSQLTCTKGDDPTWPQLMNSFWGYPPRAGRVGAGPEDHSADWSPLERIAMGSFFFQKSKIFCYTNTPIAIQGPGGCEDKRYDEILSLAAQLRPLPPLPESARENFLKGVTLLKIASKTPGLNPLDENLSGALEHLNKAIAIAPWNADAHYNLALTLELMRTYSNAVIELRRYLTLNPPPDEAREAQNRLYKLQAKAEAQRNENR